PAFATDFILSGNLANPEYLNFGVDFSTLTASHVDAFIRNAPPPGGFSDNYFFSVQQMLTGSGAATTNASSTITLTNAGTTITRYLIDAPTIATLQSAFGATNYSAQLAVIEAFVAANPAVPFQTSHGTSLTQLIDDVTLSPLYLYKVTVNGTNTGNANSPYAGNLSANAVPEPSTWAMMLAGFGLVGFAMRRQRQSHPKVRFAF
ncbi:MAG TPA: FxDxF family PEP-CTERM protein, partial [Gemmataceae bacterium]